MQKLLVLISVLPFVLFFTPPAQAGVSPQASYEVPGVPVEDSLYEIKDIQVTQTENQVSISYTLPLELTGALNAIRASGELQADNSVQMESPSGSFDCDMTAKKCQVKYKNLEFDFAQVELQLRASGIPAEKIQDRMSVSRHFSGDPIGVIHLD